MCRDLSNNDFTGGVPYSISQMTDLQYLYVKFVPTLTCSCFDTAISHFIVRECRYLGHNQLNNQLSDMFGKLSKLKEL